MTSKVFSQNLSKKRTNKLFLEGIRPLIDPAIQYDQEAAFDWVESELIEKVEEETLSRSLPLPKSSIAFLPMKRKGGIPQMSGWEMLLLIFAKGPRLRRSRTFSWGRYICGLPSFTNQTGFLNSAATVPVGSSRSGIFQGKNALRYDPLLLDFLPFQQHNKSICPYLEKSHQTLPISGTSAPFTFVTRDYATHSKDLRQRLPRAFYPSDLTHRGVSRSPSVSPAPSRS